MQDEKKTSEIQVTPQMIEAGGKVIEESGLVPLGGEGACGERALAEEIYRVMRAMEVSS